MIFKQPLGVTLLFLPMLAQGAGFDCIKASTRIEKLICEDAVLSELDNKMVEAYEKALKDSDDLSQLTEQQRRWLRDVRNQCPDVDCLKSAYTLRTEQLLTKGDLRPVDWYAGNCVEEEKRKGSPNCKVQRLSHIITEGDRDFFYALYNLDERSEYCRTWLFEGEKGSSLVRPFWSGIRECHPALEAVPQILGSPYGTMLLVPLRYTGTGHVHTDAVFLWRENRWHKLDTERWLSELRTKLPAGHDIWKGVYPDYGNMTAETYLWVTEDGNCCPTGGKITIRFEVVGDNLLVKDYERETPEAIRRKETEAIPIPEKSPDRVEASRGAAEQEGHRPITLQLRFNGKEFLPSARPVFQCFSYTQNKWLRCNEEFDRTTGRYLLKVAPGKYRLHVIINENLANPGDYPGDYNTQLKFDVTEVSPDELIIDVPRLIHLTSPDDNNRSLDGMLVGACEAKPTFGARGFSWGPIARLRFAWDPVVEGATYDYRLFRMACPFVTKETIVSEKITATEISLDLSPNGTGEFYLFRVTAHKDGRMVGDFWTHDGDAESWNYRFIIVNESILRWIYIAPLAIFLLIGLLSYQLNKARRKHRKVRVTNA